MIVGLGLDVVELSRIRESLDKFGDKFASRILTDKEVSACSGDMGPYLAARFAAKEAASKALGTGIAEGVGFHSMEVVRQESGKPEIVFHDAAKDKCKALGVTGAHISLTHGRETVAAVVILEK